MQHDSVVRTPLLRQRDALSFAAEDVGYDNSGSGNGETIMVNIRPPVSQSSGDVPSCGCLPEFVLLYLPLEFLPALAPAGTGQAQQS